jgi:hypothetical protein
VISATKVSSCVDCGTTIIGERLRCPACHDQHAATLVSGDEDVTLPRERAPAPAPKSPVREAVIAWLGASLILALGVVLLLIAQRGCQ